MSKYWNRFLLGFILLSNVFISNLRAMDVVIDESSQQTQSVVNEAEANEFKLLQKMLKEVDASCAKLSAEDNIATWKIVIANCGLVVTGSMLVALSKYLLGLKEYDAKCTFIKTPIFAAIALCCAYAGSMPRPQMHVVQSLLISLFAIDLLGNVCSEVLAKMAMNSDRELVVYLDLWAHIENLVVQGQPWIPTLARVDALMKKQKEINFFYAKEVILALLSIQKIASFYKERVQLGATRTALLEQQEQLRTVFVDTLAKRCKRVKELLK